MEAKARGAKVIHVDPRFTRTSAVADLHVPIRAGSDIAFLGGLINYVLQNDLYFHDYVVAFTNGPTIVGEDFKDTEDLDGLFSGFDAEQRHYDPKSWQYEGAEVNAAAGERDSEYDDRTGSEHPGVKGAGRSETQGSGGAPVSADVTRDESMQHPRCVFQIVKRHFARYTPEMVERVCGVPPELFEKVAKAITENSGRDRTTCFAYAVGWTQHTVGSQNIRAASILQLLLGNIGRTGGGIQALRGHASIQGSSDIPTLFNLLPGYIPMPHAHTDQGLDAFVEGDKNDKGYWGNMRHYVVSLLKAYWGDAATADNDFCFDYLPRLTGSHGTYDTVMEQVAGNCKGYFLLGENPVVGSANARMQRAGMANLDWLVVRDFSLIESATWWKDGPEIESGEMRTADIATEVFFFPAAAHTEKSGSFTNTNRMLQWHWQAVEPTGAARSDLWFMYHLGRLVREKLAGSTDEMDRPVLDLTWDYPTEGPLHEPDAQAVLREINGFGPDGEPLSGLPRPKTGRDDVLRVLDLLRRLQGRREPGRPQEAGRRAELGRARVGLGLADEPAGPLQPCLGRSGRRPLERTQGAGVVGREQGRMDRPRRPRFRCDQATAFRAGRRRAGARCARRRRRVHHAVGRQGVALRTVRTERRADADPLRTAGLPHHQPAVRAATQPDAPGHAACAESLPAER